MMGLSDIKWANENPSEFRKQRDRSQILNEIANAESALATAKRKLEEMDKENEA